ncbi:hypothetical protein E2C01_066421 [Portunus trituberculatus]|uniref:Uncharacterized protein n=1 Tax=Portunus trituberculatus TaxID=210409 RepID=A0A5B7HSA2_PORTR|nr:hypothetical protein [Portunus trituberculatus]
MRINNKGGREEDLKTWKEEEEEEEDVELEEEEEKGAQGDRGFLWRVDMSGKIDKKRSLCLRPREADRIGKDLSVCVCVCVFVCVCVCVVCVCVCVEYSVYFVVHGMAEGMWEGRV